MAKIRHTSSIVTLIFSVFFCGQNYAQDSVTVYSKTSLSYLKNTTPSQILTDTILKNMGVYSVADAIKYFAGVQVKDYGGVGGLKTVNVRNLGAQHTVVLFNGIPINNVQNGQVDLSKFSLDNIQQIQLYNAGNYYDLQPAIAYSAASSLYLMSGNEYRNFDTICSSIKRVKFSTGSFGLVNPSAYYQWNKKNGTSIYLNAEYLHSNGQYKFKNYTAMGYDTTAERKNSDIGSFRAESGWTKNLKNGGYWNTNLYMYQSERGLPGAIVNNNFETKQRLWDKNYFIQSSYKQIFSPSYQLLLSGKVSYDYTKYKDYGITLTSGYLTNIYKNWETYLSAAHRLQLYKYWWIDVATDYRYSKLKSNIYDFAFPSRQVLTGTLSSRWYWDRLDVQAGVVSNYTYDKVEKRGKMANAKSWAPSAAFSWRPFLNSNARLRGFYKENFRIPTFNDIYYTQYASLANLKLKPERAKQLDIGWTDYWEKKDAIIDLVTLQSDFYYNIIRDKIIAIPGTNLFRWQMTNIDKVTTIGTASQVKVHFKWNKELSSVLNLQYTWENAKNKSVGTYNFPVPYSPKNSASVIVQTKYKSWNLSYSYLYVGSRYNTEDIRLLDSYMTPCYTHDLSIKKQIKIKQDLLVVSFDVSNVLNQQYEVIQNYPMPGRNYKINFQIQF